jgi:hypothetical protein
MSRDALATILREGPLPWSGVQGDAGTFLETARAEEVCALIYHRQHHWNERRLLWDYDVLLMNRAIPARAAGVCAHGLRAAGALPAPGRPRRAAHGDQAEVGTLRDSAPGFHWDSPCVM